MPNAPPYMLGVASLHGAVCSVMDMRVRLGAKGCSAYPVAAVLLEYGGEKVCMVVDRILSVRKIAPGQVERPLGASSFVLGVFCDEDASIALLSLDRLLCAR